MNTIFMNSENSKTFDPHRLLLNPLDKINVKGSDKYVASSNLSIYYTWKNTKKSDKNNKSKISALTWNGEFQLPDESYSVTVTDDSSIRIYLNKIEIRIMFKIKTRHYLELLTPKTMKLIGITKSKITKDKNGENVPHSEITEVVLIHCNIMNIDFSQNS